MRKITFETFLKQYIEDVSGEKTLNIHKLIKLSKSNHRIITSLVLYCLFKNKMHILFKYIDRDRYPMLNELTIDNYLDDKFILYYDFQKVHTSYRRRRNRIIYDDDIKSLVRVNILKMMKEKEITAYRLCIDLNINYGNVNDYLKNNHTRKVSLKLVKEIYNYCLAK